MALNVLVDCSVFTSSSSSHLSFPEGFRVAFPSRTNYMYARVRASLPQLRALTTCLWLRSTERGPVGTPLSYAVPGQPNELVLLHGPCLALELLVNDKVAQLPLNLTRGSWQHMCVSWSQKGGAWQAYQGGRLRGEGHGLAPGHHLRAGGQLVLGQEQVWKGGEGTIAQSACARVWLVGACAHSERDSPGGGFDSTQALVGELAQVGIWDRVLTPGQVASLARCGRVAQGSLTSWTESEVEVYRGATKHPGEPCSKHSQSSQ
ncbi:Neuronal pentraxin-2 [Merluccius polli]|uniref:Neuronal pentraxin-2 n=1 Tax=Merluccius polli TaxID=89951 RepID=A0AA47M4N0_MERPO|nr:Neuronal pentraxin-2 [Merluccius polli]